MAATRPHDARDSARVHCRLPLLWRRSVVFRLGGSGAATVTILWLTPGQWRRHPSRGEPGWCTMAVGGFRLAVRLQITGVG